MMIETKNTITAKFELTKEEKVILSKAENILEEVFEQLREVSAVTLEDLTQIAEEEVFLPDYESKNIAAILALDGKAFTLEE
jgi:hypothetical protein|nr:MAG TPA: hypothetical protein [Caudoviricetes sp.]